MLTRGQGGSCRELSGLPGPKAGWTVANQPVHILPGGEETAVAWQWSREDQFLEAAAGDDFIGVQAYTRTVIGPDGPVPPGEETRRTLTGWEFYPGALADAVRHTAGALAGLGETVAEGIDVRGYLHWSLLDNYEWGSYRPAFGLVAADPLTFERRPKSSARWYGAIAREHAGMQAATTGSGSTR